MDRVVLTSPPLNCPKGAVQMEASARVRPLPPMKWREEGVFGGTPKIYFCGATGKHRSREVSEASGFTPAALELSRLWAEGPEPAQSRRDG